MRDDGGTAGGGGKVKHVANELAKVQMPADILQLIVGVA